MCLRILGCIFLVVLPGALQAQGKPQVCPTSRLSGGFFFPVQPFYDHDTTLTYACDPGLKPAAEGWWATSTCHDGEWSHQPECIDVNACLPPTILNAEYTQSRSTWYEEGSTITVTCMEGYEHKETSTTCVNGTWSSMPVCERSPNGCHDPPEISHAVVINQEYQEVFAAKSKVQYECEDGYTAEESEKSITCEDGKWTAGPTCSKKSRQDPRLATSGISGSTTTGSNNRGTDQHQIRIDRCGPLPLVLNGVVLETEEFYIKYKCASFYKRVGPEIVRCRESGSWSEVPRCRAAFCSVDTAEDSKYINVGVVFLKDGEKTRLECTQRPEWWFTNYSDFECNNGRLKSTKCCSSFQLSTKGNC